MNRNLDIPAETFTQIESYLLQTMSAAQQQQFEAALANDILLQEQTKQVQLVILGIKEAVLTEQLDNYHQDLQKTTTPVKKIGTTNWKPLLAAASLLLILTTAGWIFYHQTHQNETIYANYFKPDPGLITAMSSSDNYVFDKAMVDYKTGNYTEAITAWKGLQNQQPASDTLDYFIGVSLLANEKPADAIPYLQRVTKQETSYFLQDANWYLGLALVNEKRINEAVIYLKKSNHPDREKLLSQLKKLQ